MEIIESLPEITEPIDFPECIIYKTLAIKKKKSLQILSFNVLVKKITETIETINPLQIMHRKEKIVNDIWHIIVAEDALISECQNLHLQVGNKICVKGKLFPIKIGSENYLEADYVAKIESWGSS